MSSTIKHESSLALFIIASLFIHILFLLMATSFPTPSILPQKPNKSYQVIPLRKLDQKIRTVGTKDGTKNTFSLPPQVSPQKLIQPQKPRIQPPPSLNLNSLQVNDTPQISPIKTSNPSSQAKKFSMLRPQVKESKNLDQVKAKYILKPDIDPKSIRMLQKSQFDIQFEPPEGVSEDELNKIEQIFYSFQKRVYESYVSSFMRSLADFQRRYPNYSLERPNEIVSLSGKVTFDSKGNVRKIQIIQSGHYEELDVLFQSTLNGIEKLSNPPKDFIKDEQSFSIYYRLVVR